LKKEREPFKKSFPGSWEKETAVGGDQELLLYHRIMTRRKEDSPLMEGIVIKVKTTQRVHEGVPG